MTTIDLGSKLSFQDTNKFVETVSSLTKEGKDTIYINMKECQYLNSIMLSGLIRALKICEKNQGKIILQQVNASTMTLFETTNVLNLFSIENEENETITETNLNLSFSNLAPNQGIFELKGSLNSSDQCSKFRDFYEERIINIQFGVLDCSELFHLGGAGVNEMFRLRGILQEKSGKLYIKSPTDAVESVWKMMHLESLIPSISDLDEIKNNPEN